MLALYNEHQYNLTDLQNVYRKAWTQQLIWCPIFKLRDIIPFLFPSQSTANNLINTVFI